MAISSPRTYAEYFWSNQVDASFTEQEAYEKELSPVVNSIIAGLNISEFLPPGLASAFTGMSTPSAPAWGAIMGRFVSETADNVVGGALNHALMDFNYKMAEWFSDLRIDKETAALLWQRKKITEEMYDSRMLSAGFKEAEAAAFYESKRPYFTINDIFRFSRYHGDPDDVMNIVDKLFDVSKVDYKVWDWLSTQQLTTEHVQSLFKRGVLSESEVYWELGRIGWQTHNRNYINELAYTLPNSLLMVQGDLIQDVDDDEILQHISVTDIHPDYADKYYQAVLTKPNTQDIINYLLRIDPGLGSLNQELRRIGIHPNYYGLYKELSQVIPPVNDIITMAVREAFTPSIAARFGQYEDFPNELGEWAQKKGLSREWAQRYWAAHWALPSPQQGFEMLHRGIIEERDLDLLLRAQDIMPFWRDKLKQIAYRVPTRVDIRRMYALGVMTEDEVTKAYQDRGYNEDRARQLTDFTVKQIRQSQSKFNQGNVVTAYKNRVIDVSELRRVLREIGTKDDEINYIVQTATYQREWDYKTDQVAAVGNLYRKKIIQEDETRTRLVNLRVPSEEINILLQKWQYKVEEEKEPTWTSAQTLAFLKKDLISRERAVTEFQLLGYNEERINVYLSSVTPV